MRVEHFPVAVGALVQAVLLFAQLRGGSDLTTGFLFTGFVGGAVAGVLAPENGQPWLDGFVAGALGLGLVLAWLVALGVWASLATPAGVLSGESFAAVAFSGWVAVLVVPFHAVEGLVGAAVSDALKRRLWT